ncbi:flagellar hook protein FlgE [Hasllibacter halocynthiae]|uniref:Flagellar hook protein FlgE n=1 Tax=Hasllibacter halocynthiae TaxID=595589 RepID=A0A2T0X2M5_9RHOB|nr:flagellar hook-basal body complex protein [Hasllibacter halocynthiae]PRY93191.1 flagellar hook protein FlgE [Hasllibacter halocynthiae]
MSISSSLNAGVSGLNANAQRLSTISDNIANSGTYGYRRAETDFHSIVIDGRSGGRYAAGGVRTSTIRLIDERGTLTGTSNPTDLAISGRGMLPVTTVTDVANGGSQRLSLTPTGSFRPDDRGFLTSPSGLVLMGWPADGDGNIGAFPRDTVASLEPIQVDVRRLEGLATSRIELGVNLPATQTIAGAPGAAQSTAVEYFDNLGASQRLNVTFTPSVPAAGASNTWTMTVRDGAQADARIAEYTVEFDPSRANGGALLDVTAVSGAAYDPRTGVIPLTVAGGPIDLDIGRFGQLSRLTQLSNSFSADGISKNGAPVGNLVDVEVDGAGIMSAVYDTGFTRAIYQIPVADVPNPNALTVGDNQTYEVSAGSGSFFLWNAGEGPTGEMVGFAREESTTDVAAELTQLIQTQRAYSSNAKVIQTVDEMLQETTNIKR